MSKKSDEIQTQLKLADALKNSQDIETITKLVKLVKDINTPFNSNNSGPELGITFLFMTLSSGDLDPKKCIEIMNILVKAGADINKECTISTQNGGAGMYDDARINYFHYVLEKTIDNKAYFEIFQAFLKFNPRWNQAHPYTGLTPQEIVENHLKSNQLNASYLNEILKLLGDLKIRQYQEILNGANLLLQFASSPSSSSNFSSSSISGSSLKTQFPSSKHKK